MSLLNVLQSVANIYDYAEHRALTGYLMTAI